MTRFNQQQRRVVITGMGIVSPLGNSPDVFYANLIAGNSGIRRIAAEFLEKLDTRIAAQVEFDASHHFSRQELNLLDRVSQFSVYAAKQAVLDAGLDMEALDKARTGVYMGTGMGGATALEDSYKRLYLEAANRLKPFTVLMAMNNAPASQIALEYGLQGPNLTFSTACSSSAIAIGEAYRQIRHGYADTMLAGGSEALLTFGTIKAWEALRTLAEEDPEDAGASCKPFSADRTGLVLGEGGAVVVLEELDAAVQRGAYIYGEITGFGSSNDCSHITQPSIHGQAAAMSAALFDAQLAPRDIGYINAHGTGTMLNDRTETNAIKQVWGEYAETVPISSTKSMHGHLMGAAGAVEFIATTLSVLSCTLPPTMHLAVPDAECDLDYIPNQARNVTDIRHAMSNSFAFGGTSGVLIVSRLEP